MIVFLFFTILFTYLIFKTQYEPSTFITMVYAGISIEGLTTAILTLKKINKKVDKEEGGEEDNDL